MKKGHLNDLGALVKDIGSWYPKTKDKGIYNPFPHHVGQAIVCAPASYIFSIFLNL